MGMGIAIAVLIVLATLPLGVYIRYNDAGLLLKVVVGPLKITVFPRKKKRKIQTEPTQKQESEEKVKPAPLEDKPPQPPKTQPETKEKGGSLTRFLPR